MTGRTLLVAATATMLLAGPAPARAALRAGAASVDMAVPAGTPLAGYGAWARRLWLPDVLGRYPHAFWLRPSEGALDPVRARALVIDSPQARLAWVTVDLVAVDSAFTHDVAARLVAAGVRPAAMIVSASHTHSGPGAFIDSALMGWLTMDRADPAVRDALLEAVVSAVRRADAAAVPATVAVASVTAPPVTRSRLGRTLDREVIVLKIATPAGVPVAALWNFAIHGTMLSARNLKLSGDVMGAASADVERDLGVPTLFVNGAVGDVSPARHGVAAAGDVGAALAAAVRRGWSAATASGGDSLRVRTARVALGSPRLSLSNCTRGWVPRFVTVPLGSAFPRAADLLAVSVGSVAWVAVPGELQTALGEAIKRDGRALFAHAFVAGVSNDYLGYFVTPQDYDRAGYVTCAALYGPRAGDCLVESAVDLLHGLAGRTRPARAGGPSACDAAVTR